MVNKILNRNKFLNSRYFLPIVLLIIVMAIYYKLFLFGKIPFPGDLLIGSYSPWLDYYKMPIQNPLISDVFSQLFLWKYLSVESFKNLQWPLWNPFSFTGNPLLANYQSAALYPLNLFLLIPSYIGWGIFIFSQTLIASLTMYLLVSTWVESKLARLAGSIIFALGGMMSTWVQLGTAVHGMAWLPLALFSIEKYTQKAKTRYLILLSVSLALIILSGHVQVSLYSLITVALFTIFKTWQTKNFHIFLYQFTTIMFFVLFALLLSAPQIFASYDLLQKSIRLTEAYSQGSNFGLLPLRDVYKFFSADFFGSPITRNYWGTMNYQETSGFIGSLTLPILLFSLLYLKKTRTSYFFLTILGLSLILAFDNLFSSFLYHIKIPLLTSSYASRILFLTTFAVAGLSTLSINQISSQANQFNKFSKLILWSAAAYIGTTVGVVAVYFIIKKIILLSPSKFYLEYYLSDPDYSLTNFMLALKQTFMPLIFSIFFLILNIFLKNKKILLLSILVLLITIDLGRYFTKFNPFVSQSFIFPSTPSIDFLKSKEDIFRIGREHAEVLPPNTWTAYKLQSFEGYDPLYFSQYGSFMRFLNGGDLRTGNSSRYAELSASYTSPFLDAANVKYFMGILRDQEGRIPGNLINFKLKEAGYKIAFQDKSSIVLENTNVLDRAYLAKSFIIEPSSKIEDIIMTDKSFNPKEKIALSDNLSVTNVTGEGTVKITNYTPNQVTLETNTQSEEILVLADQFDDSWKATIDGRETPVSRANLIFRAIRVPQGAHNIIFYYWPQSFELGLKTFTVASLCLLIILLISLKKKVF